MADKWPIKMGIKLNLPGVYPPKAAPPATRACGLHVLVWLAILSGLWLGGCVKPRVSGEIKGSAEGPVKRPERVQGFDRIESGFGLGVQYAAPAQPTYGYETLEVYVSNLGEKKVQCAAVRLNGSLLPWPSASAQAAGTNPATGGTGAAAALPETVTWWQCYPSATLAAGEIFALQVNFRLPVGRKLELEFSDGRKVAVAVPRFRPPAREITAITWQRDYGRLFVQCRTDGSAPERIWVNGRAVKDLRRLMSADGGPEMLSIGLPAPVRQGQPVAVCVEFENGEARRALVRAWAGIGLDAYALDKAETNRVALGLDADPGVRLLKAKGGDVACTDAKTHRDGSTAMAIAAERETTYARDAKHLAAVHYCTSMRPPLWNVYGGLADAVYANPYRFGFSVGKEQRKYMDDEETAMTRACLSARPRPWLYMPEAFRRKERFLEPEELRVLIWTALARGCKGLCAFAYELPSKTGYKDDARLVKALPELYGEIRARAEILAPLAPVTARAVEVQSGWVKVFVGWAGEQGLMVMVRNLDFEVDAKPVSAGRAFRPREKTDVVVPVAVPEWCKATKAVAWAGEGVELEKAGAGWQLRVGRLGALAVAWLPNNAAVTNSGAIGAKKQSVLKNLQ